jgi:hypothetical protein
MFMYIPGYLSHGVSASVAVEQFDGLFAGNDSYMEEVMAPPWNLQAQLPDLWTL